MKSAHLHGMTHSKKKNENRTLLISMAVLAYRKLIGKAHTSFGYLGYRNTFALGHEAERGEYYKTCVEARAAVNNWYQESISESRWERFFKSCYLQLQILCLWKWWERLMLILLTLILSSSRNLAH